MTRIKPRSRQLGTSLVEVSVALVIMGVAATMSWQAIQSNSLRSHDAETHRQLQRAEAALLAYVAINNHLPCPASEASGWEDCSIAPTQRTRGKQFFPYRTVGVPDMRLANLRYRPYVADSLPKRAFDFGKFHVLLNDLPIDVQYKAPRAQPTPLQNVASSSYDGIPDTCEALSRIGKERVNAFVLEFKPEDDPLSGKRKPVTLEVRASQISDYLSCGSVVSVGGRSQFHAHLAAASLNKAMKDYKWIFEADYSTYNLDVAEGSFQMSSKVWGELRRWPKTEQAISKYLESRLTDGNAIAQLINGIVNQIASTASVATQASNLRRFFVNLEAARARYVIILDLMTRAEKVYDKAWEDAVRSSSSAYFIREQFELPSTRPPLGLVSPQSVNPLAEHLINEARRRAADFGVEEVVAAIRPLPTMSDVVPGSSIDFKVDTEDLSGYGLNATAPEVNAPGDYVRADEDVTTAVDMNIQVDPDAGDRRVKDIMNGLLDEARRKAEQRAAGGNK